MKETARLVLVLTVICLLSGLLLAWVNNLTAEPIKQAERVEKMRAIRKVLPEYDNQPDTTVYTTTVSGRTWTFYVARRKGQFAGAAFETVSSKGYGGDISVMVGVNAVGNVQGIEILKQKETPGLGARIDDDDFKSQFTDRSISDTIWAVTKDRGSIDEITSATISSRAVLEAVKAGLDIYLKHASEIMSVAAGESQATGTGPAS